MTGLYLLQGERTVPVKRFLSSESMFACFWYLYQISGRKLLLTVWVRKSRGSESSQALKIGSWNPSHSTLKWKRAGTQGQDGRGLWPSTPVTGGDMPPLWPRAICPLPTVGGSRAGQSGGFPLLPLEIQGSWNPVHQAPCLGALTFVSLWSKEPKHRTARRGGSPPFAGR